MVMTTHDLKILSINVTYFFSRKYIFLFPKTYFVYLFGLGAKIIVSYKCLFIFRAWDDSQIIG